MNKTKNKNLRKRRRKGKNVFWLVLSTDKYFHHPLLFSGMPHRYPLYNYLEDYDEGWRWISWQHSVYYPKTYSLEGVSVDKYTPIRVKLEICDKEPDMYIQRWKDCLFINSRTEMYYTHGIFGKKKHVQVPHDFRISNKLFPEITEKSGIVGVVIVPYEE